MKTLAEIDSKLESRLPIPAAPFTIVNPGSYYLTGSYSVAGGSGLTIAADNVTVDLNGCTIGSTAVSANGSGISLSGVRSNVTVRNGFIRGTTTVAGTTFTTGGFTSGISGTASGNSNVLVSEVQVLGIGGAGIQLASTARMTTVERCSV